MQDETYLGDGLYASIDRCGDVTLRAPRGNSDHFVVLEPNVLAAFEQWIATVRAQRRDAATFHEGR